MGQTGVHHLASTRVLLHLRRDLSGHRGYWISGLCPLRIRPLVAAAVLPALLFADTGRGPHALPRACTSSYTSAMENPAPGLRSTTMFDPGKRRNRQADRYPSCSRQQRSTQGFRYLARGPMRPYQNQGLHTWIAHWIYADTPTSGIFATPLYCGILALILQLPFSIRQDIRRRKELRYGRRLKGPILVSPRQFTNAVAGNGIGITTERRQPPLTSAAQCRKQALPSCR